LIIRFFGVTPQNQWPINLTNKVSFKRLKKKKKKAKSK
jgi:hypothetical protein